MKPAFSVLYGSSVSRNNAPVLLSSPGVTLRGLHQAGRVSLTVDDAILSKHMLMVGGTGSGKTNLFYHFVSQLRERMTDEDVMIIFDTKGDFYSRFYRQGDLLVGNSSQYKGVTGYWNIFKEIVADGWDDKEITLNAQEIARALFHERAQKTNQIFFPKSAMDIFAAVLICFVRMAREDPAFKRNSLYNDILKYFFDTSTIKVYTDLLGRYDDLKSVLTYIKGGENSAQSQGVLSELYSVVREIFIGVFAGKGGLSARDTVRSKGRRVMFVEYDLSIGSILTPVYRLLFDLALKEALGRNKTQGNVYLIIDEFKLLPYLQHIDDGVNFGRSLGVKIIAGLQSIEQLYEIYGREKGRNIAAGFSSIFAFRANDAATREFVSNLFGKNILLEQFQMTDRSIREEKRSGYVVEDWDMLDLRLGEAIVGLPFTPPFKMLFDEYK
ncbi:type IV secretion system coupling TraD/TrwB family protein [Anaerobacterium chartisolvens]|uniref:Type IV secretion system coupling TraD/TrwB family protein n=1 Tax=Anaerobacterium chartisolvens TaxID=1297424 RepID=A0A369B722_9FIRM|nr:type IV secretion system DNA-binding domain-containing protein [Anaerobacterium chartisolvens]RCX15484.1 type IV secretion system coupling TraD/TrwB family protein [Anaerobacterium chartisolvens]